MCYANKIRLLSGRGSTTHHPTIPEALPSLPINPTCSQPSLLQAKMQVSQAHQELSNPATEMEEAQKTISRPD